MNQQFLVMEEQMEQQDLITVKDLCKKLKVHESWIRRMIKANKIPTYKIAGKIRFRESEIDQWLESQRITS